MKIIAAGRDMARRRAWELLPEVRERKRRQRSIRYEQLKAAGTCPNCFLRPRGDTGILCKQCAETRKRVSKNNYYRLRDDAFAAYGGYICACCGEDEKVFLTIDHVEGGGNKHRKEINADHPGNFYRWLKNQKYPPGFKVLCLNCNMGRHRNGGVCPHRETKP